MKRLISTFALATALMASSAIVIAAPNFVTKQAADESSASGVIGTAVVDAAGEKLGDLNYLIFNPSGTITTAVVGVGGVLGLGEKNVAVPFNALKAQTNKAGNPEYALDATKDDLKNAPSYEWTEKSMLTKAIDAAKEKSGEAVEVVKEKTGEAVEAVKEKTGEAVDAAKKATEEPAPAPK